MKRSDLRESYYYHSGKVSEIVRQLGLAGLGVIWIFKIGDSNDVRLIPSQLVLVAVLIILSLGLDLLHYLAATITWGIFNWKKYNDATIKDETEIKAPALVSVGLLFPFYLKTLSMIAAYWFLISFLYDQWIQPQS